MVALHLSVRAEGGRPFGDWFARLCRTIVFVRGASELLRAGGWSEELCCLVNPGRAGRQQSASNASASFSSHLPRLHPEARVLDRR
jgi:hypothetical protein